MAKSKSSSSPSPELVAIVPVDGHFRTGVPAVDQVVAPDVAEELVASGAFAYADPPDQAPAAADEQPEGPADDAGSSDSQEN